VISDDLSRNAFSSLSLSCCAHQLPTLKAYSHRAVQLKNTWPHAIVAAAAEKNRLCALRAAALKSILIGTNSLTLWLNYCSALAIWFPVGEHQRLRCARRRRRFTQKTHF
jgi:hypothetical protein